MEQDKKRLTIVCEYEDFLRDSIDWYNSTYQTDFVFVEYISNKNTAIIDFINADLNQVFDLGRIYGGTSEAFDKNISNPTATTQPSKFKKYTIILLLILFMILIIISLK